MAENNKNTEEVILAAAKKVFMQKGKAGARMHEIAEEAGINKALLHYYFRSKDRLFETVFKETFDDFMPKIYEVMSSDQPLFKKIRIFVESYIDLLTINPYIFSFVLSELNSNPDNIVEIMDRVTGIISKNYPGKFIKQIKEAIKEKEIIPLDPRDLIINILALSVFPFIAKPIMLGIFFQNDLDLYQKFLEKRKKEVPQFIINSIRIK